jgi:hypothetical protein
LCKNEVMANVCVSGKTPFEHDFLERRRNLEPLNQQPQHEILLSEMRLYAFDLFLQLREKTLEDISRVLQTPCPLEFFQDQLLGFGSHLARRTALLEETCEEDVASWRFRL